MSILLTSILESQPWDQLQSLTENFSQSLKMTSSQTTSLTLNSVILTAYMAVLIFTHKVSVAKTSLAMIACVLIGYTVINLVAGWQYYLLLSIIYGLTIVSVRQLKVMLSCCMMMSFLLFMAWDELRYGTDHTWMHIKETQTWAWVHYELVTCFIHSLILSASVKWSFKPLKRFMGDLARTFRHICHSLGLYPYL